MYSSNDHYSKKARHQGYAARSVYKLQEIQQRWQIIKPADQVLELGAAPGSWSQYVLQQLSPMGKLVAADLKPMQLKDKRLTFYQQDFTSCQFLNQLQQYQAFNLLLSDAAPSTSGNRLVDSCRSAALVENVIQIGRQTLKAGANLVVKIFEGGELNRLRQQLKHSFSYCYSLRPKAVRSSSCEIYLIAINLETSL